MVVSGEDWEKSLVKKVCVLFSVEFFDAGLDVFDYFLFAEKSFAFLLLEVFRG